MVVAVVRFIAKRMTVQFDFRYAMLSRSAFEACARFGMWSDLALLALKPAQTMRQMPPPTAKGADIGRSTTHHPWPDTRLNATRAIVMPCGVASPTLAIPQVDSSRENRAHIGHARGIST